MTALHSKEVLGYPLPFPLQTGTDTNVAWKSETRHLYLLKQPHTVQTAVSPVHQIPRLDNLGPAAGPHLRTSCGVPHSRKLEGRLGLGEVSMNVCYAVQWGPSVCKVRCRFEKGEDRDEACTVAPGR